MIIGRFPKRKRGPAQIPASIDFAATVGGNTLHLKSRTKAFNCTINWGDGTKTVAPISGGNIIHNYSVAGTYNIIITGKSFAGFYVNNQSGKEKYVAVHSMGGWEVDTMANLYACFRGCTSLTTLPTDLFRYNTAVTSFSGCFRDCTSLTTLPPDLFRYNTAVTELGNCFYFCTSLTLRIDMFGTDYAKRFNGKSVNFSSCFNRTSFTGIQGTAPQLWSFTGLTATKSACFEGAGNSTTSLSNYNSIPAGWK